MPDWRRLRRAASRRVDCPRPVLIGGAAGFVLVVAIVIVAAHTGYTQDATVPDWWGEWSRRRPGERSAWVATGIVLLGLLCGVWVWLCTACLRSPRSDKADPSDRPEEETDRPRTGLRCVAGVGVLWSLPLLFTAPMSSFDVYSYAAIGRLAAVGLNPYVAGPGVLDDAFAAAVDPLWRWTPTPYGPLQIALLRGLAVAGDDVGTVVLLIRAAAVVGLVCAALVAVRAAEIHDRAVVLLIAVLNPVVLVHVVSGAHLDVWLGVMAVAVVYLTRSGRPATAMVVAVLAVFVKLPGAVLVGFVLLDVVRASATSRRPRTLLPTTVAGLGTFAVLVTILPNPFGWLPALTVPGMTRSGAAPSTWLSYVLGALAGRLSEPGLSTAFTVGRIVTAAAGVVVMSVLLWNATDGPRSAAFRGVGWALIVFALSSPALYPWYLTWGLFTAAVGSGRRGRVALVSLSAALALAAALGEARGLVAWAVTLLTTLGFTWWITRRLLGTGKLAEAAHD